MAVAISGAGMIASVGDTPEACFEAFLERRSGNRPVAAFDIARFNVHRAFEIDDRPKGQDRKGRPSAWLTRAIQQAAESARLPEPDRRRAPVLVGTGLRELRSVELWWTGAEPDLPAHELHFEAAAKEALKGGGGIVTTVSNACSASSFALGMAADMISLGDAEVAIVAGTDAITESMFGFADRANPHGVEILQPFDRDRKGVMLGEGAAAIVVEPLERARSRGITPWAIVRGVGMSCDARHETAPDREGVERAMRDAHARSGVKPSDIDLLMAHGTGTILNDGNEVDAIRGVFGDAASRPMITAIKSMTGHTSGGSGLMSVIAAALAMRRGSVPPTLGLENPIESAAGLNLVLKEPRRAEVKLAQIDAFGFGGVNAVVILEKAS